MLKDGLNFLYLYIGFSVAMWIALTIELTTQSQTHLLKGMLAAAYILVKGIPFYPVLLWLIALNVVLQWMILYGALGNEKGLEQTKSETRKIEFFNGSYRIKPD